MFGINDPYIVFGYILAFAMVIGCIVYAYTKRDKGDE